MGLAGARVAASVSLTMAVAVATCLVAGGDSAWPGHFAVPGRGRRFCRLPPRQARTAACPPCRWRRPCQRSASRRRMACATPAGSRPRPPNLTGRRPLLRRCRAAMPVASWRRGKGRGMTGVVAVAELSAPPGRLVALGAAPRREGASGSTLLTKPEGRLVATGMTAHSGPWGAAAELVRSDAILVADGDRGRRHGHGRHRRGAGRRAGACAGARCGHGPWGGACRCILYRAGRCPFRRSRNGFEHDNVARRGGSSVAAPPHRVMRNDPRFPSVLVLPPPGGGRRRQSRH